MTVGFEIKNVAQLPNGHLAVTVTGAGQTDTVEMTEQEFVALNNQLQADTFQRSSYASNDIGTQDSENYPTQDTEKKKSAKGWLIAGGVVVAGIGAYFGIKNKVWEKIFPKVEQLKRTETELEEAGKAAKKTVLKCRYGTNLRHNIKTQVEANTGGSVPITPTPTKTTTGNSISGTSIPAPKTATATITPKEALAKKVGTKANIDDVNLKCSSGEVINLTASDEAGNVVAFQFSEGLIVTEKERPLLFKDLLTEFGFNSKAVTEAKATTVAVSDGLAETTANPKIPIIDAIKAKVSQATTKVKETMSGAFEADNAAKAAEKELRKAHANFNLVVGRKVKINEMKYFDVDGATRIGRFAYDGSGNLVGIQKANGTFATASIDGTPTLFSKWIEEIKIPRDEFLNAVNQTVEPPKPGFFKNLKRKFSGENLNTQIVTDQQQQIANNRSTRAAETIKINSNTTIAPSPLLAPESAINLNGFAKLKKEYANSDKIIVELVKGKLSAAFDPSGKCIAIIEGKDFIYTPEKIGEVAFNRKLSQHKITAPKSKQIVQANLPKQPRTRLCFGLL